MSKFKVGDKVKVRSWKDMEKEFGLNCLGSIRVKYSFTTNMKKFCGKTVTIKEAYPGERYTIEEDKEYYSWCDDMFLPAQEMIIIYTDIDARKIVALDKITGEKAEAYCHLDDKFDFEVGATLAFERLRGREKQTKKLGYTGEVILTKDCPLLSFFTVGKIYQVKNGIIKNDKGGLLNFKKKFFNIGFAEVKR